MEPCLEESVQRIQGIQAGRGEIGAAVQAYQRLRRNLRHEIGVVPSDRTQRIYREALARSRQHMK